MTINRRLLAALLSAAALLAGASASYSQTALSGGETIVLPLCLIAAQPATLAVLSPHGQIASGVRIVLSSGELITTDESGRAHFLAPPDTGVMFARIVGTEVREAADVLPHDTSASALRISAVPRLASVEGQILIRGAGFQGDADRNHVTMNGKAALVLASSPVELKVAPPANLTTGAVILSVADRNQQTSAEITLVQIVVTNSSGELIERGKKSKLRLVVRGSTEPLELGVENLSPQVLQFPHDDEIRVRTSGGADNSAAISIKGKRAGPFSFRVNLQNSSSEPDETATKAFLDAARKIAPHNDASRIERALKNLRAPNPDVAAILKDLLKIPDSAGSPDFQALTRAARRALGDND